MKLNSIWDDISAPHGEGIKERAGINLSLAEDMNPDVEAAMYKHSQERRIPIGVLRAADNREMRAPASIENTAPEMARFVASDVNNAAVIRDDIKNANAAVEVKAAGARSLDERREDMSRIVTEGGYSPAQLSELEKRGYNPKDLARGKFTYLGGEADWPILDEWVMGDAEKKAVGDAEAATRAFREKFRKGFEGVRGSAWMAKATPATADSYINTLRKEIALMRELYGVEPGWKKWNDDELGKLIGVVGNALKIDVADVSVKRLRQSGVGMETDWAQVLDLFGGASLVKRQSRMTTEELSTVNERSPLADKMELVDHLEEEAKALRGSTWGNTVAEGVAGSLKYAIEFGLTGPAAMSSLKGVVKHLPEIIRSQVAEKGIIKAIPSIAKSILSSEVRRMPAYLGEIALDMAEGKTRVIPYVKDGEIIEGVSDKDLTAMSESFFQLTLDKYIENVSESLGFAVPSVKALTSPISRIIPQRMKNAFFVRVAGDFLSHSKGAAAVRMLKDRTSFSGFHSEYMEEKAGDAARYLASRTSEALGVDALNLNQDSLFGSIEQETATAATLLAVSSLHSAARAKTVISDVRGSLRFADAMRVLKARVDAATTTTRSPGHMEALLRSVSPEADAAYISPDAAMSFFQAAPDAARKIGIDEDAIAEAERLGRSLPVSVAEMQVRLNSNEIENILPSLSPGGSIRTVAEAESVDLAETAARAAEEAENETALLKEAMETKVSQLMSLGRPASEVRAAAKLFSLADYFGAHSGMSAVEWLNNLDIRKMETSQGMEGSPQAAAAKTIGLTKGSPIFKDDLPVRVIDVKEGGEGFTPGMAVNPLTGMNIEYGKRSVKHSRRNKGVIDADTLAPYLPQLIESAIPTENEPSSGKPNTRKAHRFFSAISYKGKILAVELTVMEETNGVFQAYDYRAFDTGKRKMESAGPSYVDDTLITELATDSLTFNISELLEDVKPEYFEYPHRYRQDSENSNRGMIQFNSDFEAAIILFEDAADASTLIHELAHYAHGTMKSLVDAGMADERMTEDLAALDEWAGNDAEKLARGFEAYIMEGKAPAIALQGAFSTLRRLMIQVYKNVKALGVEINDEVRGVFDGMLATDEAIDRDRALRDAAANIDRELLGLSQQEAGEYIKLMEKARAQAIEKSTADKAAAIRRMTPEWRREASDMMRGMRVYQALRAIRNEGGLDFDAVSDILGSELAVEFRRKGLTNAKDKSGKHPAAFAAQFDYASVEDMLNEVFDADKPREFTRRYIAEQTEAYHREYEASGAEMTANASIEALDRMSALLAVKGGVEGYRVRSAELRRHAREEVDRREVRDVVSAKKLIADCKANARSMTSAINSRDYLTAFEMSKKLRFNLEVLRVGQDAAAQVAKAEKLFRRALRAPKGSIYGDHQEALAEMAFRFGFTRTEPKQGGHTAASVIAGYNEEAENNGDEPYNPPVWVFTDFRKYPGLAFAEFMEVYEAAQFLYGEGRGLVGARESRFREEIKKLVEDSVREMEPLPHNHHGRRETGLDTVRHHLLSFIQLPAKLRDIIGKASQWNEESSLYGIYQRMARSESEHYHVMQNVAAEVTAAQNSLASRVKNIRVEALPEFPADVRSAAYRKWSPERVITCCLNMGTETNRKRLIEGFGWTDADLDNIASRLSSQDWTDIQKIWKAIGQSDLTSRIRRVHKEERHFDMKMEEALPFSVHTADGADIDVEGGYYPLSYINLRRDRGDTAETSIYAKPQFSNSGFTRDRATRVIEPVRLEYGVLTRHIFETARYVTVRPAMRVILRVFNDPKFRRHFSETQGFERYSAMVDLARYVARPEHLTNSAETLTRAILTTTALFGNPQVVAMQLASATIGINELGTHYYSAAAETAANPVAAIRFILAKSGMMRDRFNLQDLDLQTAVNNLTDGKFTRIRRNLSAAGFFPMRALDLLVATPGWKGAYTKAVEGGAGEIEAVAAADEFVARAQGASRPLDMSYVQLSSMGRMITPFYSAVSAAYGMATKTTQRILGGHARGVEAIYAAFANLVMPYLVMAPLIRWAFAGGLTGEDPDAAARAFIRELISGPFGGIPVLRDLSDYAATDISGKLTGESTFQWRTAVEAANLRVLNDLGLNIYDAAKSLTEDNPERALYLASEVAGAVMRVPAVQTYERAVRLYNRNFGEQEDFPSLDKATRRTRKKRSYSWE